MFNRYAYVNNNPLAFIDPSGFNPGLPRCVRGAGVEKCEVLVLDRDLFNCAPWQVPAFGDGWSGCVDLPQVQVPYALDWEEEGAEWGRAGGGRRAAAVRPDVQQSLRERHQNRNVTQPQGNSGRVFNQAQNTSLIYVEAGLNPNVAAMNGALDTVTYLARRVAGVRTSNEYETVLMRGGDWDLGTMLDDKLKVQLSLGEIGSILTFAAAGKLGQQFFSTSMSGGIPRGSPFPYVLKAPAVFGAFRSNADHSLECPSGGSCQLYFMNR